MPRTARTPATPQTPRPLEADESTLASMLQQYAIGEKVRSLRLRKKIGLVELGKHTGLSPSLLSKIERGKVSPPLGTLLRIAMVFSVGLDYFFADDRDRHVVAVARRSERKRFPDSVGNRAVSYHFECLDFPATDRVSSSYLAEFEAVSAEDAEPHAHEGHETVYVISGTLLLTIGSREIALEEGDSIYFDSSVAHTYRRSGDAVCRGVILTVP